MFKQYFDGKKAILFDLDGTLVNTDEYWKRAIDKVISSENIPSLSLSDIFRTGFALEERWETVLKIYDLDGEFNYKDLTEKTVQQALKEFEAEEEIDTTDGFWSLAHELKIDKSLTIGMVTNTVKNVAQVVTSKADLGEIFDLYLYGDDVKHPKPNPEIYKKALRSLKMKPSDVLVFEDSVAGAQASVKAGIDTLIIWNGEVDTYKYPEQVLDFMASFLGMAGNLDMTYAEGLEKALKEMKTAKNDA